MGWIVGPLAATGALVLVEFVSVPALVFDCVFCGPAITSASVFSFPIKRPRRRSSLLLLVFSRRIVGF
jgi:hypothetical protein